MNPKKLGGGGVGKGARVSVFFYQESKLKKKLVGRSGEGVGWGKWTDRRTGLNQDALQLPRSWGHNNA